METLYSAATIQSRVKDLADAINRDLKGSPEVHVIITLNGAFMFAADLVRHLNFPMVLHFTGGSFFEGPIKHDVSINPETLPSNFGGAPVLLLEDMLDSGKTINQLRQVFADRQAGRIQIATLLKRQGGKAEADHIGFTIPRQLFVVGYGLDLDGRYRELKEIFTLTNTTLGTDEGIC